MGDLQSGSSVRRYGKIELVKIYLTVLTTAVLLVLAFFSTGIGGEILSEKITTGRLSVTSTPPGLLVAIDGQTIGKTPLTDTVLPVGSHILEIAAWREQISIATNQTTLVHREIQPHVPEFVYGYSVGHEPLSTWLVNKTQLVIDTTPPSSEIYLDDQPSDAGLSAQAGLTLIEKLAPGDHDLSIQQKGYLGYNVRLPTYPNTLTRVRAHLKPDLLSELQKLEVPAADLNTVDLSNVPGIITRLEWGGGYDFTQDLSIITHPWNTLAVWATTIAPNLDLPQLLVELSSLKPSIATSADPNAPDQILTSTIPFAYLIDETGQIYEGLGLHDFDFTQLTPDPSSTSSPPQFAAGAAPVLIVNQVGDPISDNPSVKAGLSYLQDFLSQNPPVMAEPITQLDTIQLSFGENRVIDLEWRNLSSVVWRKNDGPDVWLMTAETPSRLYDPPTWHSTNTVVTFNEETVLPGETVTFTLPLRAEHYPNTITERLVLKDLATDHTIAQSEIELRIRIQGETDRTLEVLPTPTGSLNVRRLPGHSQALVSAIYTGDRFAWTQEETGWIEIIMENGERGWVEGRYVKKLP